MYLQPYRGELKSTKAALLRETGLHSFEKARRSPIAIFRDLIEGCREYKLKLFSNTQWKDCIRWGNGHKLQQGKFWLDIKKLFTMKAVKPWNKLLKEDTEFLSLEMLKTWPDKALSKRI